MCVYKTYARRFENMDQLVLSIEKNNLEYYKYENLVY